MKLTPEQASRLTRVCGSLAGVRTFLEVRAPNDGERHRMAQVVAESQQLLERLIFDALGDDAEEYIGPIAVENFREGRDG